jgi:hypothetical protein
MWGSAFFTTTLPTKLYVSVSILYNNAAHKVICERQYNFVGSVVVENANAHI